MSSNYSLASFIMSITAEACEWLFLSKLNSKNHFTIGLFHIMLCWRLIQNKNMIMQIITLLFVRVLKNLLNKYLILFMCEDCLTGSVYFMYFFSGWVLWGDSGFVPALDFFWKIPSPMHYPHYMISCVLSSCGIVPDLFLSLIFPLTTGVVI